MPHFSARRDLGAVVDINDPSALFDFGFDCRALTVINESTVPALLSLDGSTSNVIRLDGVSLKSITVEVTRGSVRIFRESAGAGSMHIQVVSVTP